VVTVQGRGTLDSSVADSQTAKLYRRISLRLATSITATSKELAEVAGRVGRRKDVVVLPNGVDLAAFTPIERNWRSAEVTVCTIRRLVPKNGVLTAADRMCEVARLRPDRSFSFKVIGDGPERAELESVAARAPGNLTFDFLGSVGHDDLPAILQQVHFTLFFSTAEAISLALLESMATGAIPIANAVGGLDEEIRHNSNGFKVYLSSGTSSNYTAAQGAEACDGDRQRDLLLEVLDMSDAELRVVSDGAVQSAQRMGWNSVVENLRSVFLRDLSYDPMPLQQA